MLKSCSTGSRTLENAPRDRRRGRCDQRGPRSRAERALSAGADPCWCRTRRSSAPTRASASWKRSSASSQPQPQPQGGFLDNMRDTLFGKREPRGSVPSVRAGANPNAWGPAYNQGAPMQPQQGAPMQYGQPQYGQPMPAAVRRQFVPRHRGGDGRRRGRRRAADEQLQGHVRRPAAGPVAQRVRSAERRRAVGGSAPRNSDLAREAGLDDIGQSGRERRHMTSRRLNAPGCSARQQTKACPARRATMTLTMPITTAAVAISVAATTDRALTTQTKRPPVTAAFSCLMQRRGQITTTLEPTLTRS